LGVSVPQLSEEQVLDPKSLPARDALNVPDGELTIQKTVPVEDPVVDALPGTVKGRDCGVAKRTDIHKS
jgi:hypothetical protein